MKDTFIFDVNKLMAESGYNRVLTMEEVDVFDGLEVAFNDKGEGRVIHPDGYELYPVYERHCVRQISLF